MSLEENTVIKVVKHNGWVEFKNHFINGVGANFIFRGMRSPEWKLAANYVRNQVDEKGIKNIPGIGEVPIKLRNAGEFKKKLSVFLESFKDRVKQYDQLLLALGIQSFDELNEMDWWALGQHNGLKTPLLDWTEDPFIASFFAIHDFYDWAQGDGGLAEPNKGTLGKDGEVVVWQLEVNDSDKSEFFDILKYDDAHFSNYRQQAQKGCFTYLMHDELHTLEEFYISINQSRLTKHILRLESDGRDDIRNSLSDLADMKITYSSLFPDLVGCAFEANCVGNGRYGKVNWSKPIRLI